MAPKAGSKRAAQEATEPAVKKSRANHILQAVEVALGQASFLPESCKKMLLTALPHALNVPSDQRSEAQHAAVRMIGEVIEGVVARYGEATKAAQGSFDSLQGSKSELEAAVTGAEAVLAEAAAVVDAREAARAQAAEAAAAAKAALAEKQEVQQTSSDALARAAAAQAALAAAIDVDLKAIREGEDSSAHFEACLPVLRSIGIDDSLLVAMPSICAKPLPERMRFDNLAIEELEKKMQVKAAELSQQLERASSESQAHVADTEALQGKLTPAETALGSTKEALAAVQESRWTAEAAVWTARAAVESHEPACEKARELLGLKSQELREFKDYNVQCFELLRDRVSIAAAPPAAAKEPEAPAQDEAMEPEESAEETVGETQAEEAKEAKDATVALNQKVPEAPLERATEACAGMGGA